MLTANEEVLHRAKGHKTSAGRGAKSLHDHFDVCPLRQTDDFDIASSQRKMSE